MECAMNIDYKALVDATQDDCPVPTIKTKEALDAMSGNEILKVITSKEGTVKNIRTLVRQHAYALIHETKTDEGFVFYIQKTDDEMESSYSEQGATNA
jgi:tRNA 2-thiouridine synthesizing protein A